MQRLIRLSRDWPVLASLRMRLAALVLLAVVPFFLLVVHLFREQQQQGIVAAQESTLRIVQMAADHHRELVEGAHQLLTTLALLREVQNLDGPGAQHTSRTSSRSIPCMRTSAACARMAQSSPVPCPMTGEDEFYDRACFQEATNSLTFTIGEYQVSRLNKKATLSMAYPAVDASNQLRAVVYAALDLAWLNRLATNFHLPEGSSLTVLDRNRVTLVRHPDPDGKLVGQQLFNTSVSNSYVRVPPPPSASARSHLHSPRPGRCSAALRVAPDRTPARG